MTLLRASLISQLRQTARMTMTDSIRPLERTFIFFDVVDLKRMNADYGHLVGDDILRHVARHVKANPET